MTSAAVTLAWGDGEHPFILHIGQLRELERKCAAGASVVLARLVSDSWYVDDVREVVRLGLIGGGRTPTEAHTLVVTYVDERPIRESVLTAVAALMWSLNGDPNEKRGKAPAAKATTKAKRTTASPSRRTTRPAPASGSVPATSTP